MKTIIVTLFLLSSNLLLFGQSISGTVFEKNSDVPIAFANIGIVGKNVGTVSDQNGRYTLQIPPQYHADTLRFSYIGYHTFSVRVSDFLELNNGDVSLAQRDFELSEMVVRPRGRVRERTLGVTLRNRTMEACFTDSITGKEVGLLIRNGNRVFLKEVNLNIIVCTFDSIFYRINIYKVHNDMQFENILPNPVYVSSSSEEARRRITIDLRHLYLALDGDFLVTFENVKDLGAGRICFSFNPFQRGYERRTSHGTWERVPIGISISVLVDEER
jgi:hypothetical protein